MEINKIFIGYDSKQVQSFHTCMESIIVNASSPVSVTPLIKGQLPYNSDKVGSTEFSYTRFLVPYLCDYEGQALYIDSDFIFKSDVNEIFAEMFSFEDDWEVAVCKHDYTPKHDTKFFNNPQTKWERKNWSSLMLFNNSNCHNLSLRKISESSGENLHRLQWADKPIQEIPIEYNFLVGEYEKEGNPKAIHYTNGGPWIKGYEDCDYAEEYLVIKEKICK